MKGTPWKIIKQTKQTRTTETKTSDLSTSCRPGLPRPFKIALAANTHTHKYKDVRMSLPSKSAVIRGNGVEEGGGWRGGGGGEGVEHGRGRSAVGVVKGVRRRLTGGPICHENQLKPRQSHILGVNPSFLPPRSGAGWAESAALYGI